MLDQELAQSRQHDPHLVGRGFIDELKRGLQEDRIPTREIHQLELGEIGIWNRDHGAIDSAHADRAQTDGLDRPELVAEATEFADPNWRVREEDEATYHVLERGPHGQSHRQATDAEPCEHRRHGHTEGFCQARERIEREQHRNQLGNQAHELCIEGMRSHFAHPNHGVGEQPRNQEEQPNHGEVCEDR